MSMGFMNMLSPVETRPVETYIGRAVDAVTTFAKNKGYEKVDTQIHSRPQVGFDEGIILVVFTLTTNLGKTDANVQIKVDPISGEPRVHNTQGFPDQFQPLLHDLPALASGGQDSSGVQAVRQDHPPQSQGGQQVEAGATAPSKQQLEQAAVTLIDVATVRMQLAKGERTRRYIGASGIGNKCMAYQALTMRGFPSDTPDPQLIRIFNDGHDIEAKVVAMLKECGHKVEEIDPSTGEQWEFTALGGHYVCHLDGFITLLGASDRMVLEIKSMNRKSFESFEKKGVQLSHPDYYYQINSQMSLSGVRKCFFIAYCKDNSKYHVQIVDYSASVAEATFIVAEDAAECRDDHRLGKYQQQYECKSCFKRTSCWEPNVEDRHCALCKHSTPTLSMDDHSWWCKLNQMEAKEVCGVFKLYRPTKAKT